MEWLHQQFRDENLALNKIKVCRSENLDEAKKSETNGTFLDLSLKPAMSFVQLVQIEGRLHLITAQAADTMVIIEMSDGNIIRTQAADTMGVGGNKKIRIQTFDITGASRVIGFSDGIGEFLTFEEVGETVRETESESLFDRLKEKITSKSYPDIEKVGEEPPIAANNFYTKKLDTRNKNGVDDMALFVLDL